MSSPPSPSSAAGRTLDDQDNPYDLQHFQDDYNHSLSDVRPFSTSLTGDQTHDAAAAAQLPSFQAFARHQENSHKDIDVASEYYPYAQPLSIGSIENRRPTSQPTADGVYDGYGLPPSKTDIRPPGSSVTGTTAADPHVAPRAFGQMSVNSKSIKKIAPPEYYTQQEYK